jgi:hypothetical protein
MPYIPKVSPEAKRRWIEDNMGLSYEDAQQAEGINYEDAMGAPASSPERSWGDWYADQFESIAPQEVSAGLRTLAGRGSYEDNRKDLERKRQQGLQPGDNRTLGQQRAGYAMNLYNNATLGWGPEVLAGIETATSGGDYDKNLERARGVQQEYREKESDWSAGNILSGGTGFVLSGGPLTKLYQGAQGAIRGVRAGLGAETAAQAAQAAGKAIPAGVAGRIAAAPTTAGGRTAENIAALGLTGAAAGELAPTGQLKAEGMGVRMATNAVLGSGAGVLGIAATSAGQKMQNLILSSDRKAARYLAQKFYDSGKTIDDFAEEYFGAAASGKPLAPVDVAPQSVRDAGTAAARMPGAGRDRATDFLEQRQQAMGQRLADDMEVALGKPPGSFVQTADEIAAARSSEAKPYYDRAFEGNKPVSGNRVVELTNRPSGKSAIQQGLKMAQDEGIPLEELVVRDAKGNIVGYTMKAMHYGKMALDDMIDSAVRSGNNQAARNLTTLKNQWLDEMDRLSPDYAQGRKIFAGHSANNRALEAGRKAVNSHPDQIKKDLSGMSKSEQEFYRQGYSQRVVETIESAPDKGNMVNRIFGTQAKRDRMRAVLGDEQYEILAQRYGLESKMYRTYADVNVGSPTAQRTAAQQDLNEGVSALSPEAAIGMGQSISRGSIMPLLNQLGWQRFQAALNAIGARTREKIVKLLFSNDPDEVRAGLKLLDREYAIVQRQAANRQGAAAATAGSDDGREVARNVGLGATVAAQSYSPF